ncbi:hypothetical protein [Nocardia sp. NPDC058705]|uniref:hypothetical protein n=1 Tax=Nocardia sp. NPDC058705 TaxID=3346609 RepID=UPI0036A80E5D
MIDKLPCSFGPDDNALRPDSPFPMSCPIGVVIVEHLDSDRTVIDLRWSESTSGQVRFTVPTTNIAT